MAGAWLVLGVAAGGSTTAGTVCLGFFFGGEEGFGVVRGGGRPGLLFHDCSMNV